MIDFFLLVRFIGTNACGTFPGLESVWHILAAAVTVYRHCRFIGYSELRACLKMRILTQLKQ